jgi:hypothetical protein
VRKRTAAKPVVSGPSLDQVADLRLAVGGGDDEEMLLEAAKPTTTDRQHKAVLDFIKG